MSQPKLDLQCREIYFSGFVQGVGFRYTTRAIAARFDVRGYVKNLVDGRVLLVVEGEPDVLDQFVAAVEAELSRHIENRQTTVSRATGQFGRFEVRY